MGREGRRTETETERETEMESVVIMESFKYMEGLAKQFFHIFNQIANHPRGSTSFSRRHDFIEYLTLVLM